jgi:DNA polymerase
MDDKAKRNISIDFETYSECPIKKTGSWRYAEDPSTKVLCMAYKVANGATEIWTPGQPIPDPFLCPEVEVWGWNVAFEIGIWENICVPLLGFPEIPLNQWRDTMALAAYFGLPLDLEQAAAVVGTQPKDARGKKLITLLCQPSKTVPTQELYEELYEYCKQDVRAETSVRDFCPRQELPELEQRLWYETLIANRRGVRLDNQLVAGLTSIRDATTETLSKEILSLTDGISASQVEVLRRWVNKFLDEPLEDLTAGTVKDTLALSNLHTQARLALEIRQAIAKTSVKKLDSFKACQCEDDTVKGAVVYYGAGTGRFAGRLFQLHNFPRGSFPVIEDYVDLVKDSPDWFDTFFDKPMDAISTMIRPCLVPHIGYTMYDADYAAIEARGTAWVCGQESMLRNFRSKEPIYELMAVDIFNKPLESITFKERFVGKQAVLGLGYQMGANKFLETCINYGQDIGIDLATTAVEVYREKNFKIVNFWRFLNDTVMEAIEAPGTVRQIGPCKVASTGKFMFIQLPSGRSITYCMPRTAMVKKEWGRIPQIQYMGLHSKTNQWTWIDLYGGKLLENIVQAVARDVMREGIFSIVDAGFEFLLSVHDQILAQAEEPGRLKEFINLITHVPSWANGFPLAAEGKQCLRFSK